MEFDYEQQDLTEVLVKLNFLSESFELIYFVYNPGCLNSKRLSKQNVNSYQTLINYLLLNLFIEQIYEIKGNLDYLDEVEMFYQIISTDNTGELYFDSDKYIENKHLLEQTNFFELLKISEVFFENTKGKVDDYQTFIASRIWKLNKFKKHNPKMLINIIENITNDVDDYNKDVSTIISVKDLKITNNDSILTDEELEVKIEEVINEISSNINIKVPISFIKYQFQKAFDLLNFYKMIQLINKNDEQTLRILVETYNEFKTKTKIKTGDISDINDMKPLNLGKAWTTEDDRMLAAMYESKSRFYTLVDISKNIKRDIISIIYRLENLKIINNYEVSNYMEIVDKYTK